MSRPSEITRDRILKTAVRLFAERGYEATSIRTLAAKAHVNQAAINYHFKTKDGLYREVLRDAIHALTQDQLSHAQETQAMPRERALAEFVRQQLRPLVCARRCHPIYSHSQLGSGPSDCGLSQACKRRSGSIPGVCCRSDAALHARRRSAHADHGCRLASTVSAVSSYAIASSSPCHPFRSSSNEPARRPALVSYQRVGASGTCAGKRPRLAVLTA